MTDVPTMTPNYRPGRRRRRRRHVVLAAGQCDVEIKNKINKKQLNVTSSTSRCNKFEIKDDDTQRAKPRVTPNEDEPRSTIQRRHDRGTAALRPHDDGATARRRHGRTTTARTQHSTPARRRRPEHAPHRSTLLHLPFCSFMLFC